MSSGTWLQPHAARARVLDHQPQLHALVGLQADDQPVGGDRPGRGVEHRMRDRLEGDDDLRLARGQALSGAQIEGHPAPAPVADLRLDGHEGFGLRGAVAQLVEVAFHRPAVGRTGAILSAYGEIGHGIAGDRLQRLQHFQLLVTERIRCRRGRRFHGDKAEELQHVVLHHVAQARRPCRSSRPGPRRPASRPR